MESLAKRAAMQMGSARQQMFALSRQPRYSVEGGGTGQVAALYGSADIPVGDASSLRLGAGGYRVDVPGYKESGLTGTDIGFRTPLMGGDFSAGVSRDMQRGVNAGRVQQKEKRPAVYRSELQVLVLAAHGVLSLMPLLRAKAMWSLPRA